MSPSYNTDTSDIWGFVGLILMALLLIGFTWSSLMLGVWLEEGNSYSQRDTCKQLREDRAFGAVQSIQDSSRILSD